MSESVHLIVSGYIRDIQLLLNDKTITPYEIILICNQYYINSNNKFILCSIRNVKNKPFFISLNINNKQIINDNNILKIKLHNTKKM